MDCGDGINTVRPNGFILTSGVLMPSQNQHDEMHNVNNSYQPHHDRPYLSEFFGASAVSNLLEPESAVTSFLNNEGHFAVADNFSDLIFHNDAANLSNPSTSTCQPMLLVCQPFNASNHDAAAGLDRQPNMTTGISSFSNSNTCLSTVADDSHRPCPNIYQVPEPIRLSTRPATVTNEKIEHRHDRIQKIENAIDATIAAGIAHQQSSQINFQTDHLCQYCQEVFKNKVSFNLHRRQKHGDKSTSAGLSPTSEMNSSRNGTTHFAISLGLPSHKKAGNQSQIGQMATYQNVIANTRISADDKPPLAVSLPNNESQFNTYFIMPIMEDVHVQGLNQTQQIPVTLSTLSGVVNQEGTFNSTLPASQDIAKSQSNIQQSSNSNLLHPAVVPKTYKCDYCGVTSMNRAAFVRHKNREHPYLSLVSMQSHCSSTSFQPRSKSKPGTRTVKCGKCGAIVSNQIKLCVHLHEKHNEAASLVEQTRFQKMSDFFAWKSDVERTNKHVYLKRRKKDHGVLRKHYYYCRRSGCFESKASGYRSRISKKVGYHCSGFITACENLRTEEVRVEFCLFHYCLDEQACRRSSLINHVGLGNRRVAISNFRAFQKSSLHRASNNRFKSDKRAGASSKSLNCLASQKPSSFRNASNVVEEAPIMTISQQNASDHHPTNITSPTVSGSCISLNRSICLPTSTERRLSEADRNLCLFGDSVKSSVGGHKHPLVGRTGPSLPIQPDSMEILAAKRDRHSSSDSTAVSNTVKSSAIASPSISGILQSTHDIVHATDANSYRVEVIDEGKIANRTRNSSLSFGSPASFTFVSADNLRNQTLMPANNSQDKVSNLGLLQQQQINLKVSLEYLECAITNIKLCPADLSAKRLEMLKKIYSTSHDLFTLSILLLEGDDSEQHRSSIARATTQTLAHTALSSSKSSQPLLSGTAIDQQPPQLDPQFTKLTVIFMPGQFDEIYRRSYHEAPPRIEDIRFRIKCTTDLSRLKRTYVERISFAIQHFGRLKFFYRDRIIEDNDTPLVLNMNSEDIVQACFEMNEE